MVCLLLIALGANAQSSNSDLEMWNSLGVEKSLLNKKLKLGFNQEFRFDQSISHLNNHFSELQIEFNLLKALQLGYGYRYIYKNKDEEGYDKRQRFQFDLSYNQKTSRLKMSYRIRYQERRLIPEQFSDQAVSKMRFRVKSSYNLKNNKINPFLAGELFYLPERNENSGFEKLRISAGLSRKTKKVGKLNMYYRFEQGFRSFTPDAEPVHSHIIGLNYTFKL